jgi:hypothetical protein
MSNEMPDVALDLYAFGTARVIEELADPSKSSLGHTIYGD